LTLLLGFTSRSLELRRFSGSIADTLKGLGLETADIVRLDRIVDITQRSTLKTIAPPRLECALVHHFSNPAPCVHLLRWTSWASVRYRATRARGLSRLQTNAVRRGFTPERFYTRGNHGKCYFPSGLGIGRPVRPGACPRRDGICRAWDMKDYRFPGW